MSKTSGLHIEQTKIWQTRQGQHETTSKVSGNIKDIGSYPVTLPGVGRNISMPREDDFSGVQEVFQEVLEVCGITGGVIQVLVLDDNAAIRILQYPILPDVYPSTANLPIPTAVVTEVTLSLKTLNELLERVKGKILAKGVEQV